jgi:putative membrane protein
MGFWGWAMMLAFWTLIVILLVRAVRSGGSLLSRTYDAVRMLDERFARGEIDAAEYEERRQLLERRG